MPTNSSTPSPDEFLPRIVEAALTGNRQRVELLTLTAIRSLKSSKPEVADELGNLVSRLSSATVMRGAVNEPPPADAEGGMALVRFEQAANASEPIFPDRVQSAIERFLAERQQVQKLLKAGFAPPRTILLKGPPGTGKTTVSRFIANRLGLRLAVLDLASSISSYLGKTGSNLRRTFDFARSAPCVLLLDEFDAIGKRRDDNTEVGELKRIVNVLLKELEDWPSHSVLIAATNHPELLDPAIHRRFDVVIDIPLPSVREREAILARACGSISAGLPDGFLSTIAALLDGKSGSDVETLANAVARRHLLSDEKPAASFIAEMESRLGSDIPKHELAQIIAALRDSTGMSVREIAAVLGKGSSTVQYHLKKKDRPNGRQHTKTDSR